MTLAASGTALAMFAFVCPGEAISGPERLACSDPSATASRISEGMLQDLAHLARDAWANRIDALRRMNRPGFVEPTEIAAQTTDDAIRFLMHRGIRIKDLVLDAEGGFEIYFGGRGRIGLLIDNDGDLVASISHSGSCDDAWTVRPGEEGLAEFARRIAPEAAL